MAELALFKRVGPRKLDGDYKQVLEHENGHERDMMRSEFKMMMMCLRRRETATAGAAARVAARRTKVLACSVTRV